MFFLFKFNSFKEYPTIIYLPSKQFWIANHYGRPEFGFGFDGGNSGSGLHPLVNKGGNLPRPNDLCEMMSGRQRMAKNH